MQTNENIRDILERGDAPFDIVAAFEALSTRRKVALCDRLFRENRAAFRQMANVLWPDVPPRDLRKLERFLMTMKKAY